MATDARRMRQGVAAELRALADRIAAGDLPEAGSVVELARRVERTLKEQRPRKRPGERAAQARRLGGLLTQRTGVDVRLVYEPGRNWRGQVGYYRVEWSNGPTVETIRRLVAELAGRVPALEVEHLHYCRGVGDLSQVAALLRHLDEHPDEARAEGTRQHVRIGTRDVLFNRLDNLAQTVADDVDYPERLVDEQAKRRIRAVCSLDGRRPIRVGEPSPDAWLALGDHILAHGWPATAAWLDQIAAALDDPTVDQLADRRARRTRPA